MATCAGLATSCEGAILGGMVFGYHFLTMSLLFPYTLATCAGLATKREGSHFGRAGVWVHGHVHGAHCLFLVVWVPIEHGAGSNRPMLASARAPFMGCRWLFRGTDLCPTVPLCGEVTVAVHGQQHLRFGNTGTNIGNKTETLNQQPAREEP